MVLRLELEFPHRTVMVRRWVMYFVYKGKKFEGVCV